MRTKRFSTKSTIFREYIKFSSLIFCVILVYLLFLGAISYNNFYAQLEKKLNNSTKPLVISEIDNFLDEVYREADFFGQKIIEKKVDDKENLNFLLRRKHRIDYNLSNKNLKHWSNFDFMNEDGSLVLNPSMNVNTFQFPTSETKSDTWALKFGNPTIMGKYEESKSIPIAFGIEDKNFNYIGSLVSYVYFQLIYEKIVSLIPEKNVDFRVYDFRGNNIVDNYSLDFFFLDSESSTKYPFKVSVGYNKQYYFYQFLASMKGQLMEFLFLGGIIVILLSAFYRKIINPVLIISDYAKKIVHNEGDFIPIEQKIKEFKELSETVQSIGTYKREILKSNRKLMNKTKELEETKVYLEKIIDINKNSDDTSAKILKEISLSSRSSLRYAEETIKMLINNFNKKSDFSLSDKEKNELLESILSSIQSIKTYTSNNLDLSTVGLVKVINECIVIKQKAIHGNNINLRYEIDNNLGSMFADKAKLSQIFNSVIKRSLDFLQSGEEIEIFAKKKKSKGNNYLLFEVKDNGMGISSEKRKEISKNVYKFNNGGIDLEIEAAKKLVELHGGEIIIKDEWKKGSTITLKLPYEKKEDQKPKIAKTAKVISVDFNHKKNK